MPLEGVEAPGPIHLHGLPGAARVQPAVVDKPQNQTQKEADAAHRQQHLKQDPTGQPGTVSHPGDHHENTVTQKKHQVDGGAAPSATLSHIEPGEIKDGGHCCPVQPLRAGIWHKVGTLKPDPEQQHQPQAQEVQSHIAGEEG